jgi:hypothetical protein
MLLANVAPTRIDRVGRLDDSRVATLLDSDVAGGVHHNCTHVG